MIRHRVPFPFCRSRGAWLAIWLIGLALAFSSLGAKAQILIYDNIAAGDTVDPYANPTQFSGWYKEDSKIIYNVYTMEYITTNPLFLDVRRLRRRVSNNEMLDCS